MRTATVRPASTASPSSTNHSWSRPADSALMAALRSASILAGRTRVASKGSATMRWTSTLAIRGGAWTSAGGVLVAATTMHAIVRISTIPVLPHVMNRKRRPPAEGAVPVLSEFRSPVSALIVS